VSPLRQPVADVLPTVYCPEDYGLKAWNWNPDAALATLTTRLNSTAGRLNIFRLSLPKPTLITNIHTMITATPTTLTAGQCGVALYNTAGNLVGSLVTGVDTAWATLGFKTHALASGPFWQPAGHVTVAMWWNGTTAPGMMRTVGVTDVNLAFTTGLELRWDLANASITTAAPASLSNLAGGTGTIPLWTGLS
jgi:hypothetical protein